MVWVAFSISGQDMEAACDQKVLAMEGEGARSGYSSTLLSCVPQKRQSQLPLAFGESHPARRIRQVLGWKKPKVWVAAVSALVLVLLIAGFSTSRALSPENVPAGWKGVEVAFPANELGTPDPYPDFFETSFRLRLAIPEGWEVRQPTQEEMAQPQAEQPAEEEINTIAGFSPLVLVDQQGEKVGSLGFYPFHYYSDAGEQDPETYPLRAVYNEFLSNMFIQAYLEEGESMTAPSGTGCTTLCPIEFIATGYGGERPNASSVLKQGVLSYDFQSQGYAVLVLEPERLDQQQLKILGESLSFVTEK